MRYAFVIIVILALMVACTQTQQSCPEPLEKEKTAEPVVPVKTNATQKETPKENETTTVTPLAVKDTSTRQILEGEVASFSDVKAKDDDDDYLTYKYSAPLNSSGKWQTREGDAGEYNITISVSDRETVAKKTYLLVVVAKNKAPIITEFEDITVDEGQTISLNPKINDPEGSNVTVSYSGFMKTSTYTTKFTDAGKYQVTVTASDGKTSVSKTITVTVNNVNRAPVIDSLKDIAIKENQKVSIKPTATDPDGDSVTFRFSEPLDEKGEWQTANGDAGKYRVNVTASDGSLTTEAKFFIVVEVENNAPVFEKLDAVTIKEGESLIIDIVAKDAEKDKIKITGIELPRWAKLTTDNGKGILELSPGHDAVTADKTFSYTFVASDGKADSRIALSVTVINVNRPPVFDP